MPENDGGAGVTAIARRWVGGENPAVEYTEDSESVAGLFEGRREMSKKSEWST